MKRLLLAITLVLAGLTSAQAQFNQPYSGAVERTDRSKMSDIVSVFDFIPVSLQAAIKAGTSTTDVSSYLTAMQSAVPAGVKFLFPSGQYNIGAGAVALTGRVIDATGATFTGGGSITGAEYEFPLGASQATATANQVPIFPGSNGAPVPGTITAPIINYTAPGGRLRTQQDINDDVINLKNFALGDGSDQTTDIQAAFDYAYGQAKGIFIPCGTYLVTTTINVHNVSIESAGPCARLETTANIPIFQVTIDEGSTTFAKYKNLLFVGTVAGTRTSLAGFQVTGTAAGNLFGYNAFDGIQCAGIYACLRFSINKTGTGGEEGNDWNSFSDIKTNNNGANPTDYGILFDNGSGTGNVFANSNLVVGTAGIRYGGANGNNVGDILINNVQVAGAGTCFSFSSTAAYRYNIALNNVQCDGGPTTFIDAVNYSIKVTNPNLGGTYVNSVSGTLQAAQDFNSFERKYGVVHTIASTVSDDFFTITLPSSGLEAYGGVLLEIYANGFFQSIGPQLRTSRYHIGENGSCSVISVTQLDTYAGGSTVPPFTFASSISTCTVTFSLVFPPATGTDSQVSYSIRAVGNKFDADIIH